LNPLFFVDVETTGLDPTRHEVIEIGAILTTPGLDVIRSFSCRMHPARPELADEVDGDARSARAVNGYRPDHPRWADALPHDVAVLRFAEFLGASTDGKFPRPHPVGKNVGFDLAFLSALFARAGWQLSGFVHHRTFDLTTLALPFLLAGLVDRGSLDDLARLFQLPRKAEHEGLEDCELTLAAFRRILPIFTDAARAHFVGVGG
jgi:DNA polymerase-3 subunit epsilon